MEIGMQCQVTRTTPNVPVNKGGMNFIFFYLGGCLDMNSYCHYQEKSLCH